MKKSIFFMAGILLLLMPLQRISGQNIPDNPPDSLLINALNPPDSLAVYALAAAAIENQKFEAYSTITFPSMESMAAIRNITIPVDHYTGRANVQIPLCSASTISGNIPVTLSYNTSGIRAQDYATWVGLGWTLNAGGYVTRIIKSLPDENPTYGYFNRSGPSMKDFDLHLIENQGKFDDLFTKMKFDGEPDMFFFQIPGYSGMFLIDENNMGRTIPYQNIKIEWQSITSTSSSKFVITDPQGNKYVLGDTTNSRDLSTNQTADVPDNGKTTNITTWHLNSIHDAHGQKIAEFTYVTGDTYYTEYRDVRYWIWINATSHQTDSPTIKTVRTRVSPSYLSRIKTLGGEIEFISQKQGAHNRVLNEIRVKASNGILQKNICFEYGEFGGTSQLRLEKISELYNNTEMITLCSFQYHNVNIPGRNTDHTDNWGYYNGKNNSVKYSTFWARNRTFEGGDRNPDINYAVAQTLKRITYPNGRYREFSYELNSGRDSWSSVPSRVHSIGGLRITRIEDNPGAGSGLKPSIMKYEYMEGFIPRIDANIATRINLSAHYVGHNTSAYKTDINGNAAGYSKVKEILPDGSYTIYSYSSYNEYPDILPTRREPVSSKTYYADDASTSQRTPQFWKRGLLREKVSYTAAGVQVSKNTYVYFFPLGGDYYYEWVNRVLYFVSTDNGNRRYMSKSHWYSQPVLLMRETIEQGPYNLRVTVDYEYDTRALPVKITTIDASGNTIITENRYAHTLGFSTLYYGDPDMTSAIFKMLLYKLIFPVESITIKNGYVIGGHLTYYKNSESYGVLPKATYSLKLKEPIPLSDYNSTIKYYYLGRQVNGGEYTADVYYDTYDNTYQPVSHITPEGQRQSIIPGYPSSSWSGTNTLKIADVVNARYSTVAGQNEVFHTSFEYENTIPVAVLDSGAKSGKKVLSGSYTINLSGFKAGAYKLSYWERNRTGTDTVWKYVEENITVGTGGITSKTINAGTTKYIDELRIMPKNAYMKTYTYDPRFGITSETDANGRTIYYEYNIFGLPVKTYNNERRLINTVTYDNIQN